MDGPPELRSTESIAVVRQGPTTTVVLRATPVATARAWAISWASLIVGLAVIAVRVAAYRVGFGLPELVVAVVASVPLLATRVLAGATTTLRYDAAEIECAYASAVIRRRRPGGPPASHFKIPWANFRDVAPGPFWAVLKIRLRDGFRTEANFPLGTSLKTVEAIARDVERVRAGDPS